MIPSFPKLLVGLLLVVAHVNVSAQRLIDIDIDQIITTLAAAETNTQQKSAQIDFITLPMPDGTTEDFAVSPLIVMPSGQKSNGGSYTIYGLGDNEYSGTMSIGDGYLNATIQTPAGLLFIKNTKVAKAHKYIYWSETPGFPHAANDALRVDRLVVDHEHDAGEVKHVHDTNHKMAADNYYMTSGTERKVVDLFLIVDQTFAVHASSQGKTVTTLVNEIVTGVNAIYIRDFNTQLSIAGIKNINSVTTEDYTQGQYVLAAQDYFNNNVADGDVLIGTKEDVDISHLLLNDAGGGAAFLSSACFELNDNLKSGGYSGLGDSFGGVSSPQFITLLAHELTHHLGGNHTWSGQSNNCVESQFGEASAYEPGSGSTLASYAGICGDDNIQGEADPYFHTASMFEVNQFTSDFIGLIQPNNQPFGFYNLEIFGEENCIGGIAFQNALPVINTNPAAITCFDIPKGTPFELIGTATDEDGDVLSYNWEQLDLAPNRVALGEFANSTEGPIYRSYPPNNNGSRAFPMERVVMSGVQDLSDQPSEVGRDLTFAFTVKDGKGGVVSDRITLNVTNEGPFKIANLNTAFEWQAGTGQTLIWDVAGTASCCPSLDVLISRDGINFEKLLSDIDNDGVAIVNLPGSFPVSSTTRLKLACASTTSIKFYDVTDEAFMIVSDCVSDASLITSDVSIAGDVGDAILDLDLTEFLVTLVDYNLEFDIEQADPNGTASIEDINGGCEAGRLANYELIPIVVDLTGNYKFSTSPYTGSTIFSIHQSDGFSPSSPCSSVLIGSNNKAGKISQEITVKLEKDMPYVIYGYSGVASYELSWTGPGNIYRYQEQASTTTSYTYVATEVSTGLVSAVSAIANFTTLQAGEYLVSGISYPSGVDVQSWIGQPQLNFSSHIICGQLSSNNIEMTISRSCLDNVTHGVADIISGQYNASNQILSQATIGATGAIYKAGNMIILEDEFSVINNGGFEAIIADCNN